MTEPPPLDRRVEILARDLENHAKSLTEIISKINAGFTPEQMTQIHQAMREELSEAGLRLDNSNLKDEAREDFRFLRRLRLGYDGAAKKIGNAVLTAAIVIGMTIMGAGFWAWLSSGGK